MPDGVFTMDAALLEQCHLYFYLTNQIPHPEFIASLPANYLNEIAMFGQGVKFFADLKRRPPSMR